MKKVLFPFEIDREAYKEAYISAVSLARNLRAELILLNAFYVEADNSINRSKYIQLLRNNWFKAYKEIHFFHEHYLRYYASMEPELRLKTDHRFVHGNLVDEFRILVNRENIDVVVLPATDENESTLRKIKLMMREALDMNLASVLITPPKSIYKPIENILYVYSEKEQKALFNHLYEIVFNTSIGNATFHLVQLSKHGVQEHELEQEPFTSIIKEKRKRCHVVLHMLKDKHPRKEITEFISEYDIQLLALPKSQFRAHGNNFRRYIIKEMCCISKIPILILKDTDLKYNMNP
jgi:hypothetical protein